MMRGIEAIDDQRRTAAIECDRSGPVVRPPAFGLPLFTANEAIGFVLSPDDVYTGDRTIVVRFPVELAHRCRLHAARAFKRSKLKLLCLGAQPQRHMEGDAGRRLARRPCSISHADILLGKAFAGRGW